MARRRLRRDPRLVPILRRLAEEGCAQAQLEYARELPEGSFGSTDPSHGWTWRARAARTLPEAQEWAACRLRVAPHPLPAAQERQARAWELAAAKAGRTGAMRAVAWWWMRPP